MNQSTQQLTGFQLARRVASWLPAKDEAVAIRMIERVEREQSQPNRLEAFSPSDLMKIGSSDGGV